ncbi:TonB-dependent receptor [Algicola sagamiensis]|uniref:TonB-dependent receptor n=1 Tax=Algicola sagamiensis TaxID=163869 RepID=UPI0003763930|nr:TonB-dependent receptor [Algicola sagamiensis]
MFIPLTAIAEVSANKLTEELAELSLEELLDVEVYSRLPQEQTITPHSVTTIHKDSIEKQRLISNDLGFILSHYVPSMPASTMTATNRSTTIRGRRMAVLINGVPIGTPLRNGDQELRSLDASILQSVEVMNGANALYGVGSSGGTINYITKSPTMNQAMGFETEINSRTSLTHIGGSGHRFLNQSMWGSNGQFSYYNQGSIESVHGLFYADGDRVPSKAAGNSSIGLPESQNINLYSHMTYRWGKMQLSFNGLYYKHAMDDIYETTGGNAISRTKTSVEDVKARANTEDPGTQNIVLNLTYKHLDMLGSKLNTQIYYQDYDNIFGSFQEDSPLVRASDKVGQSTITAKKHGLRFDLKTPTEQFLNLDGNIIWGADLLQDKTGQTLLKGSLGGDIWTPFMTMKQVAPFVQFQTQLYASLSAEFGIRHEKTSIHVDDFNTVFGGSIQGGSISFSKTSYNFGIVYQLTEHTDIYSNLSEGYDVPELGRVLRNVRDSFQLQDANIDAVDNRSTEAGFRYDDDDTLFSLAFFRSTSDLGLQLTAVPNTDLLTPEQSAEVIEGFEISLNTHLNQQWSAGGTFAWLEGQRDSTTGREYLSGQRIPPAKVTTYLEYTPKERLQFRIQSLYSGDRNRFPESIGSRQQFKGDVRAYSVYDFFTKLHFGQSDFVFSIHNLFNKDYYSVFAQSSNLDRRMVKSPGRTLTLSYRLKY